MLSSKENDTVISRRIFLFLAQTMRWQQQHLMWGLFRMGSRQVYSPSNEEIELMLAWHRWMCKQSGMMKKEPRLQQRFTKSRSVQRAVGFENFQPDSLDVCSILRALKGPVAAWDAWWGDLSNCEVCLSWSSHGSGQRCRAPSTSSLEFLEKQEVLYPESALWSPASLFWLLIWTFFFVCFPLLFLPMLIILSAHTLFSI